MGNTPFRHPQSLVRLRSVNASWQLALGVVFALGIVLVTTLWQEVRPVVATASNGVHQSFASGLRVLSVAQQGGYAMHSAYFTVHYPAGATSQAAIVLAALDRFYPQIWADYGLTAKGPWPVELETEQGMTTVFGANPPVGAYWQGVIWLLEPSAWLPSSEVNLASYERYGPAAHETTHLADDLRGGGRLPRWLDEGLAQYEDWRLTGYLWQVPGNSFTTQRLYTYAEINDDFNALSNVAMAYRQSLAATAAICRSGPGACLDVVTDIEQGQGTLQAIAAVLGPARFASWMTAPYWRPGTGPVAWTPAGPAP